MSMDQNLVGREAEIIAKAYVWLSAKMTSGNAASTWPRRVWAHRRLRKLGRK